MKAKTKKTLMWVGAIGALVVVGGYVIKRRSSSAAAPQVAAPTSTRTVSFFGKKEV